jgi:hypothetical protein
MGIPAMHVNLHPERPIHGVDTFFETVFRNASSIDEVIELLEQTDLYESGDAVVISPGLDGELVFRLSGWMM